MAQSVLAAQLYTVREFTQTADDFASSMKKIRDIGYTGVQVSGIGPIPDAQVKAIVDDVGLTICNTHVRPADALWNDLDTVIAQHHLWDCKHVAIGSMPGRYRKDGEAGFKRFAEQAARIGEKLYAAGLTFSYHNHSFEFVRFGPRRSDGACSGGARSGLDIIYEESDPRYLQAELDTYWIQHGGGDSVAWINKVKGRMPNGTNISGSLGVCVVNVLESRTCSGSSRERIPMRVTPNKLGNPTPRPREIPKSLINSRMI